jgi:hypothetical protein
MSALDICAARAEQWSHMTEESRRLLGSEIEKRKADCAPYGPAIQALHERELHDRMYNNQSP